MADRKRVPERMDDPALPPEQHFRALAGLARINRLSRSAATFWPALQKLTNAYARPVRVLDVACGGADVTIALAQRARRRGLDIHWHACDISRNALELAARRARAAGLSIQFFQCDVLNAGLPSDFEALTCSLFLHHLARAAAVAVLQKMAAASQRVLLVNDLRRCALGTWLARTGSQALSASRVVHIDAVRSAQAAFTVEELFALATEAGLAGCTVEPRWPARMLLEWWR